MLATTFSTAAFTAALAPSALTTSHTAPLATTDATPTCAAAG